MKATKPANADTVMRGTIPGSYDLHCISRWYDDGSVGFVSAWKPTPKELEALNNGGFVTLECIGGQPHVALGAMNVQGLMITEEDHAVH